MARVLLAAAVLAAAAAAAALVRGEEDGNMILVDPKKLEMFVDELPSMPKLDGFRVDGAKLLPASLTVGMFEKTWKFHRDLPPTPVFAYGTSKETATVPGPTIEAVQGVPTYITWQNHLPSRHILPWDPTIPTAVAAGGGIPTVVHLHGGIQPPTSDGNAQAWFTANFNSTGATFSSPTYTYPNVQEPGNLWYHDHAMGLTRINLLAGLIGAYTVRNPAAESPLHLPSGDLFDRHLVLFDRSFRTDGSLYMNSTGDNPSIHPQWQPEYFGDAIIVNGKAWPYLHVHRRRYRFRIINASNARFFRLFFTNGLCFTHIGSDSTYLAHPVPNRKFLLAPSEIADVVVDFAESKTGSAVLANDSPYPYPTGDPVDDTNGIVMKFIVSAELEKDDSRVPKRLLRYQAPANPQTAEMERYIVMYEYESRTGDPTHLYINGKSYEAAVTETPREGSSEVWNVINLTDDNHPLHIHLGLFVVLEQRELKDLEGFKSCMVRENDARRCRVEEHAVGVVHPVPRQERGWKNVFKMGPGRVTRILVRFSMLRLGVAYPFNATAEPGYVYHCHILDHEDNAMMRPLKIIQ